MDKEKFRRDILTLMNARKRERIAAYNKADNDAANFKRERIEQFQSNEWRRGRNIMK